MKAGYRFIESLLFAMLAVSLLFAIRLMAADGPVYVESQRVLDNFGRPGGNPLVPGDAYRVQTDRRTANRTLKSMRKKPTSSTSWMAVQP